MHGWQGRIAWAAKSAVRRAPCLHAAAAAAAAAADSPGLRRRSTACGCAGPGSWRSLLLTAPPLPAPPPRAFVLSVKPRQPLQLRCQTLHQPFAHRRHSAPPQRMTHTSRVTGTLCNQVPHAAEQGARGGIMTSEQELLYCHPAASQQQQPQQQQQRRQQWRVLVQRAAELTLTSWSVMSAISSSNKLSKRPSEATTNASPGPTWGQHTYLCGARLSWRLLPSTGVVDASAMSLSPCCNDYWRCNDGCVWGEGTKRERMGRRGVGGEGWVGGRDGLGWGGGVL